MGWSRFLRRKRWDEERTRELDSYIEIETQENIARGIPADEARHAARLKLGNPTLIREEIYRMNSITFLESLWQDVRYSLRTLKKNPAFTAVVIASLALGIGANTAIFSLIDAALLKMLPVKNPEQLVQLTSMTPNIGLNDSFSYPALKEFRSRREALSGVLAFRRLRDMDFEVNGHSGLAQGQVVSGDYFSTLGVNAILGRTITPEDENLAGQAAVAVIGYEYWRERFALDPAIIGKKIVLNNSPFTIVGVTPPEFYGLQPGERIDVSIPLTTMSRVSGFAAAGTPYDVLTAPFRNWLYVMARLTPGVTKERALAELQPVFSASMREAVEHLAGLPFDSPQVRHAFLETRLQVQSGGQGLSRLRSQFSKPLWIIMGVVALLLLVTCANVANLLLARSNARQKEIAVRLTVGAGSQRLIRQLITEGVLLAIGGGALGLLLAWCASRSLLALMSHAGSPVELSVKADATVLAFTLLVSLSTALLFSLIPAWRAAHFDLSAPLVQSTRASGATGSRSRLAKALVIAQVAVSLVLLAGATLLARSLQNLKNFYPGFNKENVLLLSINPDKIGYTDAQLVPLYERLLDRIKSIPGVRRATFSVHSPLSQNFSSTTVNIQGHKPRVGQELAPVVIEMVGPEYFRAMEAPVLLGRDFTDADRAGAPKVAAINETMAHYYFGDANPIGRRFNMPGYRGDASWLEIVAVVKDSKNHDLREQASPMAYVPLLQAPESGITFEIRTAMNPLNAGSAALQVVKTIDGRMPVAGVKTLSEQVDDSLIQERLVASLSSMFGALAAILACVGLYGLMAYAVNRRTNEIGIRMALGARRVQIARMVLRETLLLVAIGLAIGIPAAISASRLIRSELFGLQPTDPAAILTASLLMASIAALAGYLPARRASRVDPMFALRYE